MPLLSLKRKSESISVKKKHPVPIKIEDPEDAYLAVLPPRKKPIWAYKGPIEVPSSVILSVPDTGFPGTLSTSDRPPEFPRPLEEPIVPDLHTSLDFYSPSVEEIVDTVLEGVVFPATVEHDEEDSWQLEPGEVLELPSATVEQGSPVFDFLYFVQSASLAHDIEALYGDFPDDDSDVESLFH